MFEGNKKTVLLVEDEPLVALNQKVTLERNGLDTYVAHTGMRAIHVVQSNRDIDLVLMDIDLGGEMDGPEAAAQILAIREIPVVFLTGHTDKATVERVRQITRYGYVVKNAGEFVLMEAVLMAFDLYAAQRRLRSVLETVPVALGIVRDRVIVMVNDHFCTLLGYSRDELAGRSTELLYTSPEEFQRVGAEKYGQIRGDGSGTVECQWRRKDGTVIDVRLSTAPVDRDDLTGEHTFTVVDITDQHRRDQEKDCSMTELNHRVKNNLMMVSALIGLKDQELGSAADLSDLRRRVDTIQHVHQRLSVNTGDSDSLVELSEYLPDLLQDLLETTPLMEQPTVEISLEPARVSAKTAVALGLIINELVTNAIKYAFPETSAPRIKLRGTATPELLLLEYNGSPLPDSVDLDKPEALDLGLQLVASLVERVGGTITVHRAENLSRFTITWSR